MPGFKPSKAIFLVSLLALCLLGAQALKDAPWHDHSHHVADCATCHLQFGGEALPAAAPPVSADVRHSVRHAAVPSFSLSLLFSHYQGRAPPQVLAIV